MRIISNKTVFATAFIFLATFLVFTCSSSSSRVPVTESERSLKQGQYTLLPSPAFAQSKDTMLSDIAERSVQKVVNIFSERVNKLPDNTQRGPFFHDPFFKHFFGDNLFNMLPKQRREQSLGSGVMVDKKGTIITNQHVIDSAEKIRVVLSDKSEFEAEVAGKDKETDLAVLKLKGDIKNWQPLAWGDSDKLRLGDVVLAVGNPFGVGNTVTMGIVSAKGRANVGIVDYEDFIQTDAAINPGNSGGALVNLRGELVGVNTAILSRSGGYQGIGFAIPSNMARQITDSIIKDGKVSRGWLGVMIQEINGDMAKALSLKDTHGVLIGDVTSGSPAEKGGLKRGDVVLKVNEESVNSTGQLRNLIAVSGANTKVKLTIIRDGKQKVLEVKLGEKSEEETAAVERESEGALAGLSVQSLTPLTRKQYEIPDDVKSGVVVTNVDSGSAAQFAGLRQGDVIREVNRHPVKSVGDFKKYYDEAGGVIAFLIQRGENTLYLALSKP